MGKTAAMTPLTCSSTRKRVFYVLVALLVALSPSKCFSVPRIRLISSSRGIQRRAPTILHRSRDYRNHESPIHTASYTGTHNYTESYSSALYSTRVPDPVVTMDTDDEQQDFSPLSPEPKDDDSLVERVLSSYLGPRIILGVLAAVYATNFPLGALMNDVLPASAATSARMLVASLALSPFVFQLKPQLRMPAVLCGVFTCMGYITQSLSLVDTDPARVSFLGSLTVLWCPLLEAIIDKKPMSIKEAPQTWLAAILCIAGIGVLELYDPSAAAGSAAATSLSMSFGDVLALLQAIGFGTGVFWTSRMLKKEPRQALPVTATLLATTALLSAIWCLVDGWVFDPDSFQYTLPGMLLDPSLRQVAGAVLWTGLISTSLNFFIELTALGRVPPSEASVILASEPLWAALFAAALYGTGLSMADSIGGALIVSACLVNAVLEPSSFDSMTMDNDNPSGGEDDENEILL